MTGVAVLLDDCKLEVLRGVLAEEIIKSVSESFILVTPSLIEFDSISLFNSSLIIVFKTFVLGMVLVAQSIVTFELVFLFCFVVVLVNDEGERVIVLEDVIIVVLVLMLLLLVEVKLGTVGLSFEEMVDTLLVVPVVVLEDGASDVVLLAVVLGLFVLVEVIVKASIELCVVLVVVKSLAVVASVVSSVVAISSNYL